MWRDGGMSVEGWCEGMVGEWRDGGMSVGDGGMSMEGWCEGMVESGGMVSTGECRMMTGKVRTEGE